MDDHSRWKETEEIYSILLTRGEDIEWRTSLESLHFQNLYLEKGFSLPLQEINAIRQLTIVRVLNSLVKNGENFLSFYSFTERTNRDSMGMAHASQHIAATPGGHDSTATQIHESFYVPYGEYGEASR
ncbi:unnamed protein product [Clonostachys rhizophaga]|uniref:Uncharacterized protein n=1 Tax=Clonostachys rhizophaga TaxID=160324 RepID=A0A9N9V3G5_9HYPO|nr:unnamed protein product [Clonostachys rhizophaga]